MIFGLFGPKKKKDDLPDLLAEFIIHQQVVGRIGKAQSLQKLNRVEEARQVMLNAEQMVTSYLSQHPHEKKAHIMLAQFYIETGVSDRAEPILERLLNSGEFQLNDDEKLILSNKLQNIQRQRPYNQRTAGVPRGFSQVNLCLHCHRLNNYVSVPCHYCGWSSQTIEEMACSIVFSTVKLDVHFLLGIAQEMANNRTAYDVVPDLKHSAKILLNDSDKKPEVEKLFALLKKDEHKKNRRISTIRECPHCGSQLMLSNTEECTNCGVEVNWPDAIKTLVCLDNILLFIDTFLKVRVSEEYSEFVCLLVVIFHNLFHKQEAPSERERQYALQLLKAIGTFPTNKMDFIFETKDLNNLILNLVTDNKDESTEVMGYSLYMELEFFVKKMNEGVRI